MANTNGMLAYSLGILQMLAWEDIALLQMLKVWVFQFFEDATSVGSARNSDGLSQDVA